MWDDSIYLLIDGDDTEVISKEEDSFEEDYKELNFDE